MFQKLNFDKNWIELGIDDVMMEYSIRYAVVISLRSKKHMCNDRISLDAGNDSWRWS